MNIALIGYGEVGRILAEDLRAQGHALRAHDIKLGARAAEGVEAKRAKTEYRWVAPTSPGPAPRAPEVIPGGAGFSRVAAGDVLPPTLLGSEASTAMRQHAASVGVDLAGTHAQAVANAELVLSAVTASQAVPVAQACASALPRGAFFLDFNSASPGAKIEAARLVDAAGGRYVEGAVMNSILPYRIKVPLLLGGPHALALLPLLQTLGFEAKLASEKLGVASATKMCRSIMIKGLEAMVIEAFTTARHYGVEDAVIASLQETYPGMDWEKQGAYFFQRVIEHGRRRSEEVREVAVTVQEAGLTPWSASGTAQRQAWVADLADAGLFGARGQAGFARSADWRVQADRILAHLKAEA